MALVESTLDINGLSDNQLDVLERQIAGKYMRIFPLGIILWGFTNTIVWLSLWPLVFLDLIPLWLAFIVATVNVTLSYLPSHDAQHSIIARKGQKLRWLNELLGWVSLIPLAQSFRVMRYTHFEHHNHTNNPELDPDYEVHVPSTWHFLRKHVGGMQGSAYGDTLVRIGRPELVKEGLIVNLAYLGILFTLAWSGYAIEAALLWWLPRHIALPYIQYYLSWMPHHPGKEVQRYRDTRGFRSRIGNLGSLGMQFHIIHHLYPTIPLMQTPAAYWALKPILQRRGCDLGQL